MERTMNVGKRKLGKWSNQAKDLETDLCKNSDWGKGRHKYSGCDCEKCKSPGKLEKSNLLWRLLIGKSQKKKNCKKN